MKKNKMRFPLSRKIALMLLVIAVILSSVLIFTSYTHYRSEMYEHYEDFAWSIGSVAASQLDPDKIDSYLEMEEPDEDYQRSFDVLCDIRENGGVMYLYVVKPEPSEVYYVLDTDPTEEQIPRGYHEPYYAGDFADSADRMVRGERLDPIISDEEYGWLMTVLVPMRPLRTFETRERETPASAAMSRMRIMVCVRASRAGARCAGHSGPGPAVG